MNLKIILTSATIVSITLSGAVLAKKPHYDDGPAARMENSNRQSDESSLRGKERAEERHYLKKSKKHKDKKGKKSKHKKERYDDHDRYKKKYHDRDDDRTHQRYDRQKYQKDDRRYDEGRDRYERQRYQEKYQNDPIRSIVDHNVNKSKSKIDNIHRQVIDSIDQKTRELQGIDRPQKQRQNTKPWWSFGSDE